MKINEPTIRITISGPQGCGKSTIAEFLRANAPFINLRSGHPSKTVNLVIVERHTK